MSSSGLYPFHQNEVIIDDADVPGGLKSSLFHTRHHPQLVPPWVEVCLHNTSLVRRY